MYLLLVSTCLSSFTVYIFNYIFTPYFLFIFFQLTEGVSNLLSVQCPTEVSDPSGVFMHQSYEVIDYDKAMYPESGRRVTSAEPFCGLGSNYNPNILYQYKRGSEHSVKVSLAFYRFVSFTWY